uniref:Uncharacterized protein n=1 Tax=Glossina pallidipes TaxID=7398 RepID=A0A1A9ZL87_GLOPL
MPKYFSEYNIGSHEKLRGHNDRNDPDVFNVNGFTTSVLLWFDANLSHKLRLTMTISLGVFLEKLFLCEILKRMLKHSGKENVKTNQGLAASTSSFRASTSGRRLGLGSFNLIIIEDLLIDIGRRGLMTKSLSLNSKSILNRSTCWDTQGRKY